MSFNTTKKIALTFAIYTLLVIIAILILTKSADYIYILLSISISLASYIFFCKLINIYIYHRIENIFKIILDDRYINSEITNIKRNPDILKSVEKKVIDWKKEKVEILKQLNEQAVYRKEFIGNVSHELKTPIFNIQGYILTLLDGAINDKNINIKYLQRTEQSIDRLISIVTDLESISKLESGELKLCYTKFDIIKEINQSIIKLNETIKTAEVKIEFKQSYEKPIFVRADIKEIKHVIRNILINSITYNKKHGIINIEINHIGEKIIIEITDQGIGIEKDNINRIFERFYRVDKSRSRNIGGSGLGLAIVKHILDAHKQTINVRSTYKQGSSFTFSLNKEKT